MEVQYHYVVKCKLRTEREGRWRSHMARHDIREWTAKQSQEDLKAVRSKGGQANAERNRRYRTFRDCMRDILSLEVPDEAVRAELEKMGLDPSFSNAISMAAIRKAATVGDIEAARFARDTVGEKPTEALNLNVDKPIKSMDLSQLSDAELEALADRAD